MIIIKDKMGSTLKELNDNEVYGMLNISNEYDSFIKANLCNVVGEYEIVKKLYNLINKTMSYDEKCIFFMNNLDLYDSINEGNVSIDFRYNKVNCKTWALLFSYYLNFYNINNRLLYNRGHMQVVVSIYNKYFVCDATNNSMYNGIYMNDLTRYKYNLNVDDCFYNKSVSNQLFIFVHKWLCKVDIVNMNTMDIINYIVYFEEKMSICSTSSLEKFCFYKTVLMYLKRYLNTLNSVDITYKLFKISDDSKFKVIPIFINGISDDYNSRRELFTGKYACEDLEYIVYDNNVMTFSENELCNLVDSGIYSLVPSSDEVTKYIRNLYL